MSRDDRDLETEPGHDRWLVSYADFITLLFAFFVVLYATSEKDTAKSQEFQESIKRYLIRAGSFGEAGQQINSGEKHVAVIDPPIQTYRQSERPETVALLDQTEVFLENNLTEEERKKYVLDVVADEWGVRVVVSANALFANGSEKFNEGAVEFISKLGGLIKKTQRKVLIEGHASVNEKADFRSPWDFAAARSINFLRFLQKDQKLNPANLASASLGDSRPLFAKGDKQKLSQNSRVELVLLNPDIEF